jgi:hypothetical protein
MFSDDWGPFFDKGGKNTTPSTGTDELSLILMTSPV